MIARPVTAVLLALAILTSAGAWLQRAPTPAKATAGRFAVQEGGKIVLDRISGLRWQQGFSAATMDWANAKAWCSANTPGLPGNAWRLPTIGELATLVDAKTQKPAIDAVFAGTPGEGLWSATPWGGAGYAWDVQFGVGITTGDAMSVPYRVRCVR